MSIGDAEAGTTVRFDDRLRMPVIEAPVNDVYAGRVQQVIEDIQVMQDRIGSSADKAQGEGGMASGTIYYLESVDRVMQVLNCFTKELPELRLVDLAARTGMNKTQVLRIAATLEGGGYLVRDPETKRFRLGLQLFYLGMIVGQQMDLRRLVHPYLLRLVEETQETARLVVPDDDEPVCVDVVESPHGVRVYAQLGARMPWNAGSTAKVILAYLPEEKREEIVRRGNFKRFTDRTIMDPDDLRIELEHIRQRGYHLSFGDLTPDARGAAAPLFDHSGKIVGSISVTAPESRLNDDEVVRFVTLVTDAGRDISGQLGYSPQRTSESMAGWNG